LGHPGFSNIIRPPRDALGRWENSEVREKEWEILRLKRKKC
jgi:hypothetical protein